MKRVYVYLIAIFFMGGISVSYSADLPAYKIFDSDADNSSYGKLLRESIDADVILFGELHNNTISHWLEFELAKALQEEKKGMVVFGAEMFETDDQLKLDEYLKGLFPSKNFEKEAKVWDNYGTDYKPLVELAKKQGIPFIATNIPRRYASFVARKTLNGLDTLSLEAKKYMAQLPINLDFLKLSSYKDMIQHNTGGAKQETMYFAEAQAVKDATMAYFIYKNWTKGKTFLHFNGSFHSENKEGIYWFLKKLNPDLKILTIATIEQENIDSISDSTAMKADFILAVPTSMTKTYE